MKKQSKEFQDKIDALNEVLLDTPGPWRVHCALMQGIARGQC